MDPEGTLFQFIILILLLCLSAFFSSSETALISFNKIKLRHLVEKGDKRAKLIFKILKEPDRLLTALLIGNNIVNILITVIATNLAIKLYGDKVLALLTVILTIIILVFAEIIPKSIAATFPEKVSYIVVYPVYVFMMLCHYLIDLMTVFTRFITRKILRNKNELDKSFFTIEEFKTMIKVGEEEGVFSENETKMLNGIMKFKNNTIKDAMKTHRTNIIGFSIDEDFDSVSSKISKYKFSRYPVYDGTIDKIVGILYAKDLLFLSKEEKENFHLENVMKKDKDIIVAIKSMTLGSIFKEMKKNKIHIAIVIDEYGGTEGIITLEDVLEIIVGDIEDETDFGSPSYIVEASENHIVVTNNTPFKYLNEFLRRSTSYAGSVSAFITEQLGVPPKLGDYILWNGFKFTILTLESQTRYNVKIEKYKEK